MFRQCFFDDKSGLYSPLKRLKLSLYRLGSFSVTTLRSEFEQRFTNLLRRTMLRRQDLCNTEPFEASCNCRLVKSEGHCQHWFARQQCFKHRIWPGVCDDQISSLEQVELRRILDYQRVSGQICERFETASATQCNYELEVESGTCRGNAMVDFGISLAGGTQRCIDQRPPTELVPGKLDRRPGSCIDEWTCIKESIGQFLAGRVQTSRPLRDMR